VHAIQQRFAKPRQPVRQRQTHGNSDEHHGSHFLNYQQAHLPGHCTQRHADPNLTRALNDHIGEHAVNSKRRQERRQTSEARRKHRDHSRREQILFYYAFHSLHIIDREVRVQLPDGLFEGRSQQQRILRRPNVEGHPCQFGPLRVGNIQIRLDRAAHMLLLYVLDHSHNLDIRLDLPAPKRKVGPEGISPREKPLHHRFTCNGDFGGRGSIRFGKFAAGQQRNSQGSEVTRTHPVVVHILQFFGELRASFDRDVAPFVVAGKRGYISRADGPDTRQSSQARPQLIEQRYRSRSVISVERGLDGKRLDFAGSTANA